MWRRPVHPMVGDTDRDQATAGGVDQGADRAFAAVRMGMEMMSTSGVARRTPRSMASAACRAVRLPLNESGAMTIFMDSMLPLRCDSYGIALNGSGNGVAIR